VRFKNFVTPPIYNFTLNVRVGVCVCTETFTGTCLRHTEFSEIQNFQEFGNPKFLNPKFLNPKFLNPKFLNPKFMNSFLYISVMGPPCHVYESRYESQVVPFMNHGMNHGSFRL